MFKNVPLAAVEELFPKRGALVSGCPRADEPRAELDDAAPKVGTKVLDGAEVGGIREVVFGCVAEFTGAELDEAPKLKIEAGVLDDAEANMLLAGLFSVLL